MDTCTVEVGLLKKHPCGANAVTKCVNCEQPLCTKHAAGKMSGGKKIFLCPECARAWTESEKLGEIPGTPAAAPVAAPPAPGSKAAPKPAAAPPKPAPAAAKPAAKPAEKKPEPAEEHSGALEFTPGKPAEAKPTPPPPPPAAKEPEPPAPGKGGLSLEEDSAPPEEKK